MENYHHFPEFRGANVVSFLRIVLARLPAKIRMLKTSCNILQNTSPVPHGPTIELVHTAPLALVLIVFSEDLGSDEGESV